MPNVRAVGVPVVTPANHEEMEMIDTPARFDVGEANMLVKRVRPNALAVYARSERALPVL